MVAVALLPCLFGCGDQSATSPATASPQDSGLPLSGSGADIIRPHPDNSAANQGDGKEALTPMNQGSSDADIRETSNIRKAIMSDPTLSINAHNIKIITNKSQVTLRGVVDSIDEHKRVNQIVQDAAGTDIIDDQLRVK
jgi:hypothetical protein